MRFDMDSLARVKPGTKIPFSGNRMNVRVIPADTRDVDLFQLLWCANNEKFSFVVIQFKIVIQHPQTSDMQFCMLFKAESWSDSLRLGLNEM